MTNFSFRTQVKILITRTRLFRNSVLFCGTLFLFAACQSVQKTDKSVVDTQPEPVEINPAAPGFNASASDTQAIAIADEVMEAMGGRESWDATRFITWNFFGARSLLWDKQGGNVRIKSHRGDWRAIVNIHTLEGRVWKDSIELQHPDSLEKYLGQANSIWINDAYWLVMPFKLKDSGVTLRYVGEDTNQNGDNSDVLSLEFAGVGDTPENKYHVWVNKEDRLVSQWSFYTNAEDSAARFVTPWASYQPYGNIMLSGVRGEQYLLSDIAVRDSVPDSFFTTLDSLDWSVLLVN